MFYKTKTCLFWQEIVCPIDEVGKFVLPVTDFEGEYVKDADKHIIKKMKADGRLVMIQQVLSNT